MACVVAPVDHRYDVADDDVSVTDPPPQSVVVPEAVIVGVAGTPFTITFFPADTLVHPPALVTVQ